MRLVPSFLSIILIFHSLCYSSPSDQGIPDKYVFLSLPKSGTHLLQKLLIKLTNEAPVYLGDLSENFNKDAALFPPHQTMQDEAYDVLGPDFNASIFCHFNFNDLINDFSSWHPEHRKIILVRDLRDVCVSTTYYIKEYLDVVLGPNVPFDERLMYVIECKCPLMQHSVYNIKKQAATALEWINKPGVVVCRFEDLCGPDGGGTSKKQLNQIRLVAKTLGIQLTKSQTNEIVKDLWGNSLTFRQGKIGSWRTHFKKKHYRAFNENLRDLLVKLGYSIL